MEWLQARRKWAAKQFKRLGADPRKILALLLVVALAGILLGRCTAPDGAKPASPTTTAAVPAGAPATAPASPTTTAPWQFAEDPFDSTDRAPIVGDLSYRFTLVCVLAVIAVLIWGLGAKGSWWRVGLVALGGAVLWLLIAPGLRPTVQTPGGTYRVSLGTADVLAPGRSLAAINTRCNAGKAEGELVNLGNEGYNVLLAVTIDGQTTGVPVLGLAAGASRAWSGGASTSASPSSCTVAFVEVRPVQAVP